MTKVCKGAENKDKKKAVKHIFIQFYTDRTRQKPHKRKTDMGTDKLQKARKIRDSYKEALCKKINTGVLPVYLENWTARILRLEYLIIDLRYKLN